MLRETRRQPGAGELVSISAADPLNLVGVVTPGPKIPALVANRVLFRDGVPIAQRVAGKVRRLSDHSGLTEWDLNNALMGREAQDRAPTG